MLRGRRRARDRPGRAEARRRRRDARAAAAWLARAERERVVRCAFADDDDARAHGARKLRVAVLGARGVTRAAATAAGDGGAGRRQGEPRAARAVGLRFRAASAERRPAEPARRRGRGGAGALRARRGGAGRRADAPGPHEHGVRLRSPSFGANARAGRRPRGALTARGNRELHATRRRRRGSMGVR